MPGFVVFPVVRRSESPSVSRRSGRYTFDRFRPIKMSASRGFDDKRVSKRLREGKVTGLCSRVGCSYCTFCLGLLYCSYEVMKS